MIAWEEFYRQTPVKIPPLQPLKSLEIHKLEHCIVILSAVECSDRAELYFCKGPKVIL